MQAVGNTLSDTLGTMLLLAGLQLNRARLRAVRSGVVARFLSLEVSSQAFLLLLIADVTVGYHSSDGWVTFVETLVARYNVNGAESVDTAIRLFVATAPVCLDVAFKLWCCACMRCDPGRAFALTHTLPQIATSASFRPARRSSWARSSGTENGSPYQPTLLHRQRPRSCAAAGCSPRSMLAIPFEIALVLLSS